MVCRDDEEGLGTTTGGGDGVRHTFRVGEIPWHVVVARDALGLLGQIEPEFEETLAERPRSRHPDSGTTLSQILDPSSNRGELTSRERLQAPFDLWLQLDRPW